MAGIPRCAGYLSFRGRRLLAVPIGKREPHRVIAHVARPRGDATAHLRWIALFEEKLVAAFDSIWEPVDTEHDDPLAMTQGIVRRMFDVTGKMPWLPSLWFREVINEGGLLRERAFARIPVQKVAGFGQNIARACASGQVNPQLKPLLLFNSVLALMMLPQATAKIWQRLNPRASFDRATLERHVVALLTQGMSAAAMSTPMSTQTPTSASTPRRPKRKPS